MSDLTHPPPPPYNYAQEEQGPVTLDEFLLDCLLPALKGIVGWIERRYARRSKRLR